MRLAASLLALLVALFAAVPSAVAAPRSDAKVVLIVGPSGEATDRYRERAEAAARVAERHTSNVVRLYSPDATWPAVEQALDGAAVVIYLGHGNGWPSRYRDSLYGPTQNGFGLNPVAGGGDNAHQYFGEDLIAAKVRLAKNAVVLLHHLCYASGNTEPGLPEGTIDQARQRVANYAAGFIEAGAGAVVAEGHMGPAWYVEQLFGSRRSIDQIWRASPNRHGNEFRFESPRSAGYVAAMDPDHGDQGFYRSIVYRGGVGGGRLEPAPASAVVPVEPPERTLVGSGLAIRTPYLKAPPVAGGNARLWFPYTVEEAEALDGLTVGVRWDPIDVDAEPSGEPAETPTETPAPTAEPEATDAPDATEAPQAAVASEVPDIEVHAGRLPDGPDAAGLNRSEPSPTVPSPAPTPEPTPPPAEDPSTARVAYIQPERAGDVVEPVAAKVGATRIVVDVTLPERPGRYRLVATLHDKAKVAYDAATQTLLGGVIVDVAPELSARYLTAPTVAADAGEAFELPVSVANVGLDAWGQAGSDARATREERAVAATLVGHWVTLDGSDAGVLEPVTVRLPAGLAAGAAHRSVLDLTAPDAPGSYLLMLDVRLPGVGSLAANGIEPALVRVTVE